MKKEFNFTIIILIVALIIFLSYNFYINSEINLFENNEIPEIAYVNLQEVYNVHPAKKRAEEKIDNLARDMEAELNEMVEDLDGQDQQDLLESHQIELNRKEQQLVEEILININQVINKLAEKKEIRLVLDKEQVVYGGYNLTEDVINYVEENINLEEDFEIEIDALQE